MRNRYIEKNPQKTQEGMVKTRQTKRKEKRAPKKSLIGERMLKPLADKKEEKNKNDYNINLKM